jgi:hypothetical protein
MIRTLLIGASLALVVPATAHAAPATEQATPDPGRQKLAKQVIENLWPLGSYRRMMDGSMIKMMDSTMALLFDMKPSDMAQTVDPSGKAKAEAGEKTMGEIAEAADPHFRERMKITMDTMMGEMIPIFEKFEPAIRTSLSNVYARDFTTEQLTDMDRFFATPTGRAYGQHWMMTFVDPEMMKNMQAFTPEFLKAMPKIMKKVEKATAHLPPPPKKAEAPAPETEESSDDIDAYAGRDDWSAEDEASFQKIDAEAVVANERVEAFAVAATKRAQARKEETKKK